MSFPEILEAVRALPPAEKNELLGILQKDAIPPDSGEDLIAKYFPPGVVYECNSPTFAPEAAAILQDLLEKHQAGK